MSKDKLTDYSATNASNTDIGGINIDEGMLPSAVNNSIREMMTHLKEFASGTNGIDTLKLENGANDWTITVTSNNIIFAYAGTDKAKLDSSGNLTVVGNVTAYGTI